MISIDKAHTLGFHFSLEQKVLIEKKKKAKIFNKKISLFILESATFIHPLRDNLLYSDSITE